MTKEFKPWVKFKKDADPIDVPGPPCAGCQFWKPHRDYNAAGGFSGVTLCVVENMHSDFSCFKPREKKGRSNG